MVLSRSLWFFLALAALDAQQGPAPNPLAIEINVRASGRQIAPGDPGGARADITNKSAVPVYLRAADVQFVFELETYQGHQKSFWCSCDGWFPNATRESKVDDPMKEVICLKPGGTSTVFPACATSCGPVPWYWEYRFLNFVPGTYPITVDAKYWENRSFADDQYQMAIGSTNADYAAPRGVVLSGAIVGAILFTLLSLFRAREGSVDIAKAGKQVLALGGAVLLSLIITILLSRVEAAESLIKVNISDFWGGIAVGFLANYGGFALLNKMVPPAEKSQKQD